jgi:hypothetical protein
LDFLFFDNTRSSPFKKYEIGDQTTNITDKMYSQKEAVIKDEIPTRKDIEIILFKIFYNSKNDIDLSKFDWYDPKEKKEEANRLHSLISFYYFTLKSISKGFIFFNRKIIGYINFKTKFKNSDEREIQKKKRY